jgi:predicted alpha/beta hydrolase family esterase
MARRDISDFRVLIVPGLHGSGPDHWQTRWERLHAGFERVEQAQWDVPDLAAWSEQLDKALRASLRPTLVVAHSFGCLAAVHRTGCRAHGIAGALLVAPADPEKFGVARQLSEVKINYPSLVIGSTNDPWMTAERAAGWACRWGSNFVNAGALGHINAKSGLGDWSFGLSQLGQLIMSVDNPERNKNSLVYHAL